MKRTQQIERIYSNIIKRSMTHELGIHQITAYLSYNEKRYKILFLKELTQQINNCRSTIIEIFGENITNQIWDLKLKVEQMQLPNLNGR